MDLGFLMSFRFLHLLVLMLWLVILAVHQVEDISFYSDTMGVEFTIQDTSEVEEEVDV